MGITGLIPFLEKASKTTNISEFSGGTAAIDAYCWLHKGVFACAEKIARGEDCDMYVTYCMKFINMLLAKSIKPVLVFDGQRLPAKMETEEKRRESREQNRKKAAELLRLDRPKEAQAYLRRCIDVTHEMALNLIKACRARNVDCIVAPYEADAQLAFLNIQDLADVIVTEDSDLLLFGAKKVLFKMDINGNGLLIEQSKLHVAMGVKEQDFSFDKFRYMCILSGCDYLSSLTGIGLVKACRFIKRTADPDIYRALTRLSLHLNMPQLCVTQEYRDKFMEADFMFKYQPVYDPRERRLRPLNDLDSTEENYVVYKNLIDKNSLSEEQLKNLAYGNLDPIKLNKMDDWSPSKTLVPNTAARKGARSTRNVAPYPSIWSENYEPNLWTKPKVEPPNALCPSAAKVNRESKSVTSSTSDRRSLPVKKIVLPKARRSVDQQFANLYCERVPAIEFTDDDTEDEVVADENSIATQQKKSHHNPFLKSSQSKTTDKKNVGMLDKLQRLCRRADDAAETETRSGYFGSDVKSMAKTSPDASTISDSLQSSPTSPIITSRSAKIKFALVPKNGDQQRSPLKTVNASSSSNDEDLGVITQKYALPSGCENQLQRRIEDDDGEEEERQTETGRKRVIPFATMSAEKKPRAAVGFLEKLNAFRRHNVTSSFSWSQPDQSKSESPLNIGTSTAVYSNFKKPTSGCNKTTSVNTGCSNQILSQPSDEDEGFCSPNSDFSCSGTESSAENASFSPPVTKLSWVNCRTSGLKKNGPKQLSLEQYAFKSSAKMKR